MSETKITDLIGENEIQMVKELDSTLERVKATYVGAAKELAKGLKINVEVVGDLEKLNTVYVVQAKNARTASNELTDALKKQSEVSQEVAKRLEEQMKAGNLSDTEMKKITVTGTQNAAALEKVAKAEAALEKAQNTGTTAKKKASLTEEDRLKLIKDTITLSNREIHSISEAREANKQLHRAVNLLKDTDESYIKTLARLNSAIGANTDYVKRNADRYTQQKMTIGDYANQIRAAIGDIERGSTAMKSMGVIAQNSGTMLKGHLSSGINQVGVSMKGLISGYVGAQAVVSGVVALFTQLREGVGDIVKFEFANSNLAAILGTTSEKIKDLTGDAQRLGATTKYTASQATELQIELAKLGFTKAEILDSTGAVLRFAQATGAELSDAAALSGAALRMFNADTKETERYVSAMAVSTARSALSFSYLATAMPIVGPVAKAFNFSIEDTLALLGKLSDAGFDASMAATATRNILLNLADGSGKLAKALGQPVKSLPELVDGLKKLKEQGVDLNTTLELTDKRSVAAFNAFLTSADKIIPLRSQITSVEGELADMAHTMGDNVQGAIDNVSSAWEAFMLSFSKGTGPAKEFLNWMADKIRGIANDLKSPEEKIGQIETNFRELAKKNANSKVLTAEKEFNAEYKRLRDRGDSEEQARTKAFIQLSKKRIEITEQERAELAKQKKGAEYSTFEFENMSQFKNAAALMFGVYTKEAEKADKAQLDFSKSLFSLVSSEEFNSGLDQIIEKYSKVDEGGNVSGTKVLTDKEKRELEKAEKEKLKLREQCQESELALVDEGYKKEVEKISLGYAKKIAAIRGGGKEEMTARDALAKEQKKAIDDYTIQYNINREKQDIANALEVVSKGSKEELDLKIAQLDLQREAEIDAAEKTGEDIFLINDKYEKKKQDLKEGYISKQILLIADNAAAEQAMRDQQYQKDMTAASEKYANDLKAGKDSVVAEEEYEENKYQITLDYARKTTEASIDSLEQQLDAAKLNGEDRTKITEELQRKKAQLAEEEAKAEIKSIKKIEKEDEKSKKKRIKNVQQWLSVASEAIGAIGDLVSSVYDGKIGKIEAEQEINDEAYDRDVERTDNLVQQKVITEEEGEARKRVALEKTEAKNAELEKKKAALAYKQAVWEKATSVSQAGIQTALAVMNALTTKPFPLGLALAITAGAIGAVQIATILATPIPSYAEGTKGKDGHPGGTALVGDAGKREVVMFGGNAWITPDIPTLVDLPKGAQVFPDVNVMDFSDLELPTISLPRPGTTEPTKPVIINDYRDLKAEIKGMRWDLKSAARQQHRDACKLSYKIQKENSL